jgi:hypothetical protein
MRYTCARGGPPAAGAGPGPEPGAAGDEPGRKERKASHWPSGDHTGDESFFPDVNFRGAPPDVATIQISFRLSLSFISLYETEYAISFPSGEIAADDTDLIDITSSNVIGRLS